MSQIEQKVKSQFAWKALAYNFLGLIIIFAALLLLRLPLLINADHFLSFDVSRLFYVPYSHDIYLIKSLSQ